MRYMETVEMFRPICEAVIFIGTAATASIQHSNSRFVTVGGITAECFLVRVAFP